MCRLGIKTVIITITVKGRGYLNLFNYTIHLPESQPDYAKLHFLGGKLHFWGGKLQIENGKMHRVHCLCSLALDLLLFCIPFLKLLIHQRRVLSVDQIMHGAGKQIDDHDRKEGQQHGFCRNAALAEQRQKQCDHKY